MRVYITSLYTLASVDFAPRRGVKSVVPNQRAAGQKLINLPASEEFIAAVDAALPAIGYGNRSEFIRDAIAEKLAREGHPVRPESVVAPARSKPKKTASRKPPKTPSTIKLASSSSVSRGATDGKGKGSGEESEERPLITDEELRFHAKAAVFAAGLSPGEGPRHDAEDSLPIAGVVVPTPAAPPRSDLHKSATRSDAGESLSSHAKSPRGSRRKR